MALVCAVLQKTVLLLNTGISRLQAGEDVRGNRRQRAFGVKPSPPNPAMCIDLHTHSSYSDGSLTPQELVDLAVKHRLRCLALTDHDTVEGVPELLRHAAAAGLEAVSGVEISTTWNGHTVHVLGYGIDPALPALHVWLRPIQEGRNTRNRAIQSKLAALGMDIKDEELLAISEYGQTGRPHFARIMVERGFVPNVDTAFNLYLGHGKAAWAPRFSYTSAEAIRIIHESGGKAVLAHPGVLSPDASVVEGLVRELTACGLDGVEVYYPTHAHSLRRRLLELAQSLGLLVTGGSDFHGAARPERLMAGHGSDFCPPVSLLPPLMAALGRSSTL